MTGFQGRPGGHLRPELSSANPTGHNRSQHNLPVSPTPLIGREREVAVLRLFAHGLTYAQTAAQLVISPRTVNCHLSSIYSKLGVTSRHAASRFAIDQHLILNPLLFVPLAMRGHKSSPA